MPERRKSGEVGEPEIHQLLEALSGISIAEVDKESYGDTEVSTAGRVEGSQSNE